VTQWHNAYQSDVPTIASTSISTNMSVDQALYFNQRAGRDCRSERFRNLIDDRGPVCDVREVNPVAIHHRIHSRAALIERVGNIPLQMVRPPGVVMQSMRAILGTPGGRGLTTDS
jgi:hypothetical protein